MGFFSALFGGSDPFGHGSARDQKHVRAAGRGARVKGKHAEQYAAHAHSREQWKQLRKQANKRGRR